MLNEEKSASGGENEIQPDKSKLTEPTPKPKKKFVSGNHLHTSTMVLLLVLMAAVFALAGYLVGRNYTGTTNSGVDLLTATVGTTPTVSASVSATVSASASADLTANWKTYTNDTYGFSVKYPTSWITENFGSNNEVVWIESSSDTYNSDRISISHYSSSNDFISHFSDGSEVTTMDQLITKEGWKKIATNPISGTSSLEFLEGAMGGQQLRCTDTKGRQLHFSSVYRWRQK